MAGPINEFTQITKFIPETFGDPGTRTFRIAADSASSTAAIWLEKEQLAELSVAMLQLAKETPESNEGVIKPPIELEAAGLTNLDFKAGRLAFGHNPETNMFIIDAHDPEDDSEEPTVRLWLTRAMINDFAKDGLKIVASGRPICPLCEKPINPDGHYCVRRNGHARVYPGEL